MFTKNEGVKEWLKNVKGNIVFNIGIGLHTDRCLLSLVG